MQAPNAEQIESAADSLTHPDGGNYPALTRLIFLSELSELESFGAARLDDLRRGGRALPPSVESLPADFRLGYLLGLQTARTSIAANPKIVAAKIDPSDVL